MLITSGRWQRSSRPGNIRMFMSRVDARPCVCTLSRGSFSMRVMASVFVLCAFGFLGADDPKKETPKIQGKWSVVSLVQGGKAEDAADLKGYKITFEEKKYSIVVDGEVVEDGDYAIDDSKSPKTIDFDIKKGKDAGKKQVGILKFEDDKVTMFLGNPGATDRPTSFKLEEGRMIIEAGLERVKSFEVVASLARLILGRAWPKLDRSTRGPRGGADVSLGRRCMLQFHACWNGSCNCVRVESAVIAVTL